MNIIGNLYYDLSKYPDSLKNHLKETVDSTKDIYITGNICSTINNVNMDDILSYIKALTTQNVFFVSGTHEYKNCSRLQLSTKDVDNKIYEICSKYEINFLQNSMIETDNSIIIGSTMWSLITDKDYEDILKNNNIFENRQQLLDLHFWSVYLLTKKINKYKNTSKKLIVLTHFVPSSKLESDSYLKSDLDYLIQNVDKWICNSKKKYKIYNTPILCDEKINQ